MVCSEGNKEHFKTEYKITWKRLDFELTGHINMCCELVVL